MAIRDITNVVVNPVSVGRWQNWARTETTNAQLYQPQNIREVVATIVQAEAQRIRIRAVGSRWSFDDCARPDQDHITVDLSKGPTNFIEISNNEEETFLRRQDEVAVNLKDDENKLVVAYGGTPLWKLNEELWGSGYSLLTLGGDQGQTLAGAFSTGTHGTDLAFSSLGDSIHAIHLVGSGGKEYWIERENGVTEPSNMRNYADWEVGCIEEIRNDSVFNSALVALGRFGIIYAVLLEVAPSYRLREHREFSSWGHFQARLRNLKTTGDLQSLDDNDIRAIKINLDPYAVNHGWFGGLVLRWDVGSSYPNAHQYRSVEVPSKGPDALAREVHASQVGAKVAFHAGVVGFEGYAENARHFFKEQGPVKKRRVIDRNYYVTSGRAHVGHTYAKHYAAFAQHGPLVYSMEYFFDGKTRTAVDFVNKVYELWSGLLTAGYIAVRFAKGTEALIGPQRFEATVIVEVTILQGFVLREQPRVDHSVEVRERVKSFASDAGALPHWGQENSLTPPEVQAHYKAGASDWRRALARVTRTGKSDTFSNRHSRRMGLELSPTLMFTHNNRMRAWFDQKQGLFAGGFHPGLLPVGTPGLSFVSESGKAVVIDSIVHAKILPLVPRTPPGSLVVKRKRKTIAEFHSDGTLLVKAHERFRPWMR